MFKPAAEPPLRKLSCSLFAYASAAQGFLKEENIFTMLRCEQGFVGYGFNTVEFDNFNIYALIAEDFQRLICLKENAAVNNNGNFALRIAENLVIITACDSVKTFGHRAPTRFSSL